MIADLKKLGVEAIQFYAHLFYNHPKANDYRGYFRFGEMHT